MSELALSQSKRHDNDPAQRILFYVNGTAGLGHLSRTVALGSALRQLEPSAQLFFLTESATTHIAQEANLSCISIASLAPYLNMLRETKPESIKPKYRLLLWENLVESVFKSFKPTIVIHDTYALEPIKRLAKTYSALQVGVLRQSESMQTNIEQLLHSLDVVIIPHTPDEWGVIHLEGKSSQRVYYSGPLIRRTVSELTPELLRERYALREDEFVVVATNGGGDQPLKKPSGVSRESDTFSETVIEAACLLPTLLPANSRLRIILITGPQAQTYLPVASWIEKGNVVLSLHGYEPLLPDLMAAAQAVICRGGYNTISEVLGIGIPTIAIPVNEIFDNQQQRIDWATTVNPTIQAGSLDPYDLATRIQRLMLRPWWKFTPVPEEQDGILHKKRATAQVILECQQRLSVNQAAESINILEGER